MAIFAHLDAHNTYSTNFHYYSLIKKILFPIKYQQKRNKSLYQIALWQVFNDKERSNNMKNIRLNYIFVQINKLLLE